MRKTLLALLLVTATAQAGLPLRGGIIISTEDSSGPGFACDGVERSYDWPGLAQGIRLHKIRIWIGASQGLVGDIGAIVEKTNGEFVSFTAWDHYADPTGLHADTVDFGDNYVSLSAATGLRLKASCTAWGGPTPRRAHVVAVVWFSDVP